MTTTPNIDTFLHNTTPEQVSLTPFGQFAGRVALGIATMAALTEGIVSEDKVPSLETANPIAKAIDKGRLIVGHWYNGTLTETYAQFVDRRVTEITSTETVEADMLKIRTCSLDPEPYNHNVTGSGAPRTPLGKRLSRLWLDELPQLVGDHTRPGYIEFALTGPRPRKSQDNIGVPTELAQRDAIAYSRRTKGVIDAGAVVRKKEGQTESNMAHRVACDIAYDEYKLAGDARTIDSALIYTLVDEVLPAGLHRLSPIIRKFLPLFVAGLRRMSATEARQVYFENIIDPANKLLADARQELIDI